MGFNYISLVAPVSICKKYIFFIHIQAKQSKTIHVCVSFSYCTPTLHSVVLTFSPYTTRPCVKTSKEPNQSRQGQYIPVIFTALQKHSGT